MTRTLIAALAGSVLACVAAVPAFANEAADEFSHLAPLDAARLDDTRAGLAPLFLVGSSHEVVPHVAGAAGFLLDHTQDATNTAQQQGRVILDSDLNRLFEHAQSFGDGIRGRIPSLGDLKPDGLGLIGSPNGGIPQIDPPSLNLNAGAVDTALGRVKVRFPFIPAGSWPSYRWGAW
jgi:hypothetical protein